jgi:hypothetical protein
MQSRAPVVGLRRDQAEETEERTGSRFGGERDGQLGRGDRAAATRGSGFRRARAAAGKQDRGRSEASEQPYPNRESPRCPSNGRERRQDGTAAARGTGGGSAIGGSG